MFSRPCTRLARSCRQGWTPARGFPTANYKIWKRGNATESSVDKETIDKLPLAGIRVLDMTRVLAGVGLGLSGMRMLVLMLTRYSRIVHRFLQTLGMFPVVVRDER